MLDAYPLIELLQVAVLGLVAGTLGGMLGVGGSTVMIPGLVFILGRPTGTEQHLYQASAMIANVAVSVPAALRHRKAGAMTPAVLRWMMPAALVCVVIGVALSNLPIFAGQDGGVWLGRLLAVFLVYVIYANVRKLLAPRPLTTIPHQDQPHSRDLTGPGAAAHDSPLTTEIIETTETHHEPTDDRTQATPARGLVVGSLMGTTAGLLGIGGGAVATPLQQTLMKLPLRSCIANSSAIICVSAAVGAVYKNLSLSSQPVPAGVEPFTWVQGLTLGLLLAPTAFVGGRLGATLTHRLPLRTIRVAFIALMVVACWKMAAL
ncbi:MAG: sulfite exporter TauE/SafE family protein [Planctomycetota bacterium]